MFAPLIVPLFHIQRFQCITRHIKALFVKRTFLNDQSLAVARCQRSESRTECPRHCRQHWQVMLACSRLRSIWSCTSSLYYMDLVYSYILKELEYHSEKDRRKLILHSARSVLRVFKRLQALKVVAISSDWLEGWMLQQQKREKGERWG